MNQEKGLLIVLSGPTGTGKGTVCNMLVETERYAVSVSATTRAPRENEIPDVSYHYISREEFLRRIEAGEMMEYNEFCNNLYGTVRSEAEAIMAGGKHLILEIDVNGAMNIKAQHPEAILILLLPPTFAEQEARLRGRNTEDDATIAKRLRTTLEESDRFHKYDYIVYNYDKRADEAAADIDAIVRAEQLRAARNPDVKKHYFAE